MQTLEQSEIDSLRGMITSKDYYDIALATSIINHLDLQNLDFNTIKQLRFPKHLMDFQNFAYNSNNGTLTVSPRDLESDKVYDEYNHLVDNIHSIITRRLDIASRICKSLGKDAFVNTKDRYDAKVYNANGYSIVYWDNDLENFIDHPTEEGVAAFNGELQYQATPRRHYGQKKKYFQKTPDNLNVIPSKYKLRSYER
jgi:hypothetical protein